MGVKDGKGVTLHYMDLLIAGFWYWVGGVCFLLLLALMMWIFKKMV